MHPSAASLLVWLATATFEASLLVALLALFQRLAGPNTRVRTALWLLLTLRLASPWLPLPSYTLSFGASRAVAIQPESSSLSEAPQPATASPRSEPTPPQPSLWRHLPWTELLGALWLLGVMAFGLRMLLGNLRLWWAVRQGRVLTLQPALELLERCKADLGVRTPLVVILTERVPSPALFGLVRPRLLMSADLLEHLSEEELRHVFLHELAHLRRLDLLWAWLSALVQVVHWFNPLVWWAFRQMRSDRELACDALALGALPPGQAPEYGRTLLRLLELLRPPAPLPSLAGLSEDRSHLSRRIQMIARFNPKHTLRWSLASLGLVGATALLLFGVRLAAQDRLPALLAKPIQDKIDYAFEPDPAVLGGWRAVDFVQEAKDFTPRQRAWKDDLYLKELFFHPDGSTNWAWTWTKGLLLHDGDKTASRYEIRELEGRTFLFMEWKSGDYTLRGMKPRLYVLERDPRLVHVSSRTTDKIDYPFVDDPAVLGNWVSVDFVETPEAFRPHQKAWKGGELFLRGLDFRPGGRTTAGWTWTRGLLLHAKDQTASQYRIQEIDGRSFLFFEWKSGDYTLRGQKPHWYVLTRKG